MSFLRRLWNTTVASRRYSVTTRCYKWRPTYWKWRPTSEAELEEVEGRILKRVEHVLEKKFVVLPKSKHRLWTIVANKANTNTPIVMVHGMGGGVGVWTQNYISLAKKRPVYAFDLLGFGRSSRPKFSSNAEEVEKEFTDSIEEWREKMQIKKMILMGHSLGAYVSSCYALKHPDRIQHLILIDPWGFQERPTYIRPELVKAIDSMLLLFKPMTVLRIAGPLGPLFVKIFRRNVQAKFSTMYGDDTILDYIYHCNAQTPPSGEAAFKALSSLLIWAKHPMLARIGKIDKELPITFVYGSETWIDIHCGYSARDIRTNGSRVNLEVIEGADHLVHADTPHEFNKMMRTYLDSIDKHEDNNKVYMYRVTSPAEKRYLLNTSLAEDRILSCIKMDLEKTFVTLPKNEHNLRTIVANKENKNYPLVLVHGMGGGVGLWGQNIDSLAKNRPVYAFDLLGFGRSSRPKFSWRALRVENAFVESLEEWRKEMKIDEMILMGHSLGAYVVCCYALKYPDKLLHLFLINPWGFLNKPKPTHDDRKRRIPFTVRVIATMVSTVNIQYFVRAAGPFSPRLIKTFRQDKQAMFDDDTILDYIDHCNAQDPSGEKAYNTLSTKLGWAKRPMINRIHKIDKGLPMTFVSGSDTWVDKLCGYIAQSNRVESTVNVEFIKGAGHHVYADKPDEFNELMDTYLDVIDEHGNNDKFKNDMNMYTLSEIGLHRRESITKPSDKNTE